MAYWKGEWQVLCILGLLLVFGLRMVWSAFTPLDPYTRRLRGDEPAWGRLLGIAVGLLFIAVGAGGLGLILLFPQTRHGYLY